MRCEKTDKLAILLIVFLLSALGYKLFFSIPRGVLPNVFFPRIEVNIDNGYAPIDEMLFAVTKPSEESLKTVQNVEKIVSSTSIGSTTISLYFNWDIDPYLAYQLVQARVAEVKNRLPPSTHISIRQATPSIYPVAIYSIGSDTLSRTQLSEKLYYELKPALLLVHGVYDIDIKAPQWSEYKIVLDAKKLQNYNLDISKIIEQLKAQNQIEFLGLIEDYHRQYVLSLYQKTKESSKLLSLNIPLGNGKSIKLSEIAFTLEQSQPTKSYSASSGVTNSVVFNLLRQSDANGVDVVNDFNEKLRELEPKLKQEHIQIKSYYDDTEFVKEATKSVFDAIILGGIIAVFILFLFLRKVKLSLATLFIIPITFLITMVGMKFAHVDLNIFSLAGMAAAIGGLIDHMIIVIENIERHFKSGLSKEEAVIKGSREILPIMMVATLLSVLIFVPLLLVSGIVGVFFKQLAFVLVVTYLISQIIAIFLTPIIASMTLSKDTEEKPDLLEPLINRYKLFLNTSMQHAWISVVLILVGFAASFYMYTSIPSTFLPKWDEGNIVVDLVLPASTSLDQSKDEFEQIGKILDQIPEVQGWSMRIGTSLGQISAQANQGDFLVTLKKKRTKNSFALIEEIRQKIQTQIPNLEELGLSQVIEDRLGDIMGADAPISVMLFGVDSNELIQQGYKLKQQLKNIKEIEEVNLLTSYASPSINITLKPDATAVYGVDEAMLLSQIRSSYYGEVVASLAKGEKLIDVRVLMNRPKADPIAYLQKELLIYSPSLNKNIPLSELATIHLDDKVAEVTHYNLSAVCVLGIRFHGNDMSSVVQKIRDNIQKANLSPDITTQISGFYKEQQKSFQEMSYVVLFAIMIIFIGLLLNFNDLRIAITILISLLLTLTGVFLALHVSAKPLDITAFMGMLIVLSIVINNNVLIYDFYQLQTDPSKSKQARIIEAIGMRIRPVLMTMLSNAFALLPIALAIGEGTQIIQDLAIAIMGGLLFAIFVNLYITPLFFYLISKKEKTA